MKPPVPPSNPSPFNRRVQHDAKRQAILSEAARLFNGKGSRATTLQDVARGLGLTKTSLYYYVKTKEELIFLCYEATLQRTHDLMDHLDANVASPLARAAAFFRAPFDNWLKARDGSDVHVAALLEIASLKPEHRERIEAEYVRMFTRLRGYLRAAKECGEIRFRESTATTRALIGAIDWVFYWLHQLPPARTETAASACWDILLHGLHPGPGYYPCPSITLDGFSERPTQGFDREEQHRQKQDAFCRAATRIFNRKGFTGTSLDEIAEQLNVSKGAFYYHIRNKEDLLYACYERSTAITTRIQRRAQAGEGSGLAKVDETARRIFHVQNSDEGPLIRYNTITALPTHRRLEILAATEDHHMRFEEFINQGKADGSVGDVDPLLAGNLMNGAINASMDIALWRDVDDIDEAAKDYFDLFYNGLMPRGSDGD